ncbi:DNA polymerase III subunit beta [Vibrio sp. D431a]|uniref:DNA polymerase III subunit beta n=1 Tax=Vibrio sp. D431a TaxID=2837388 RepID=UPI002553EE41|nr:DNA polymerase III subunit beta [Vibrio sp. D431a]MDK9789969.1 DNA polymerase III subunit beta [Vibrio sp. D431a]
MKFKINKDALLNPLVKVGSVVGGRPTLPILGNLLFDTTSGCLKITGTDLEIELVATINDCEIIESGAITIPSRKVIDIVKSLPSGANLTFTLKDGNVILSNGRSRFTMNSLSANDFPNTESYEVNASIALLKKDLKTLMQKASVAMANQDVRYYLNGVFFEAQGDTLTCVGTDGHRLAAASSAANTQKTTEDACHFITPRKSVSEIVKLIDNVDGEVTLQVSSSSLIIDLGVIRISSKLIDGRFPDYRRVIPRNADNITRVNRQELISKIKLAMILSNEKFRGIEVLYNTPSVTIKAKNAEHEEAVEYLDVSDYQGQPDLRVGYNGSYMLDALGALESDEVLLKQGEANSSCVVVGTDTPDIFFIVMPIRL